VIAIVSVCLGGWLPGGIAARAAPAVDRASASSSEGYLAALFGDSPEVQPPPAVALGPRDRAGFWEGVADDAILERIRTLPIQKITFNRGGSSLSLRLHLVGGLSAAWKPDQVHEQTVPRKEIAAYRINRLLGLSRVPPATHRTITLREVLDKLAPEDRHLAFRVKQEARIGKDGTLVGEVSYWIPEIRYVAIDQWKVRNRWLDWLKAYKDLQPETNERAAQLSTLLIFDFLINNPDRFSGYNVMSSPDGRFFYFMDNTFSFQPQPEGGWQARSGFHRAQRFSVRVYRQLKALTRERLDAELGREAAAPWPLLTPEEAAAVIARRSHALQTINGVVARFGWERTMVYP
jgi:hypothetical protein